MRCGPRTASSRPGRRGRPAPASRTEPEPLGRPPRVADPRAELTAEVAERTADLQRLSAEYANYRRRVDRDREAVLVTTRAQFVGELLTVLDDVERAGAHGDLTGPFKSVADKLVSVVQKLGLEPFGVEGEPVRPVGARGRAARERGRHRTDGDGASRRVLRRGYRIGDRVLRPAMVGVVDRADDGTRRDPAEGIPVVDPPPDRLNGTEERRRRMTQRDWIEKDFYRELGVASGASQDEIKKAYRKLARELHPDANPGDAQAEARFKSVSEAYGVLSDEKKRREYDETRALFAGGGGGFPGGFPGGAGGSRGRLPRRRADVRHGRPVRQHRRRRPGPGRPARRDLRRCRRRAARGRRRRADSVARTSRASCGSTSRRPSRVPRCRSGSRPRPLPDVLRHRCPAGHAPRQCPTCSGRGLISRNEGAFAFSEPCPDCRGTGRIIDDPCPECGGDGVSTRTRSLTIRVPAGVDDGQRIKLAGQGEPGRGGAPAGDLYVKVHVTPHRVFGRSKDNPDDLVSRFP